MKETSIKQIANLFETIANQGYLCISEKETAITWKSHKTWFTLYCTKETNTLWNRLADSQSVSKAGTIQDILNIIIRNN